MYSFNWLFSAIKKTKLQRKKSPDKAIADSDQEETKPKERPKKKKPPISSKPIVIKVESLNLDDIGAHSSTISTVEMGVPPPKTPPIDYGDEDKLPYAEESDTPPPNAEPSISNIVIPQTIKIEPPIETLVGSLQRDVQTVLVERPKTVLVEKPVVKQRAPKPKLYKPVRVLAIRVNNNYPQKPIELPQEHVQRFPNVRFQPRTNEEDMRFLFDVSVYFAYPPPPFNCFLVRRRRRFLFHHDSGEEQESLDIPAVHKRTNQTSCSLPQSICSQSRFSARSSLSQDFKGWRSST